MEGRAIAARMPMMAMTASSSRRVKAEAAPNLERVSFCRPNPRFNPFGVVDLPVLLPRVAPGAQPWAERLNAVGVLRKARANLVTCTAAVRSPKSTVRSPVVCGPVVRGPAVRGPAVRGPAVRGPAVCGPAVRGSVVRGSVVRSPWSRGPVVRGPVVRGPNSELRTPNSALGNSVFIVSSPRRCLCWLRRWLCPWGQSFRRGRRTRP